MLYLLQIYKMVQDKDLFINLFNDILTDINDLGYSDSPEELVNELLNTHFHMTLDDDRQLKYFTNSILKNQGKLMFLKSI
jgi:hypothetical protein